MELLDKLNIKYKNIKLYESALAHSSYVNEKGTGESYERLEFLGDAILDAVVSEYLYLNVQMDEGVMTKLRAGYVCKNALYNYAKELNLQNYIKVGKGEALHGGNERENTMADCFEAFIGALYTDLGYNEARNFIYKHVIPHIDKNHDIYFDDYKSKLQELLSNKEGTINYELIDTKGPSHNPEFTIAVKLNGLEIGRGISGSKKEAEQAAAKRAIETNANWE